MSLWLCGTIFAGILSLGWLLKREMGIRGGGPRRK